MSAILAGLLAQRSLLGSIDDDMQFFTRLAIPTANADAYHAEARIRKEPWAVSCIEINCHVDTERVTCQRDFCITYTWEMNQKATHEKYNSKSQRLWKELTSSAAGKESNEKVGRLDGQQGDEMI